MLCIAGPTAVGKTKLAIQLAQYYKTEIISADSRQFYKELNIGVAKPSNEELQSAKHHFIGHISVYDYYSAGDFERDAEKCLTQIYQTKNVAIAVGGSCLYLKALTEGLDEMPQADLILRNQLTDLYNKYGIKALQEKLLSLNKEKFNQTDVSNPQRVMRAIEMELQNIKIGSSKKEKFYQPILFVLNINRDKLYEKINIRVDEMIKNGLVEEAKNLYPLKYLNALQTVGYSELFDYFENKTDLQTAIEKIKQHTRNYAKKQITWFKKQNAIWLEPFDLEKIVIKVGELIKP